MSYSIRKPLFEIIEKASNEKDVFSKVETLRSYNSVPLRKLLRYWIDPDIKFLYKEQLPEYQPAKEKGLDTILYNRVRLLYLFVERDKKIKQDVIDRCLVEMLESIHPQDAEMILQVIAKKLPKGLNKQHIIQAFPEILNEQIVELQS